MRSEARSITTQHGASETRTVVHIERGTDQRECTSHAEDWASGTCERPVDGYGETSLFQPHYAIDVCDPQASVSEIISTDITDNCKGHEITQFVGTIRSSTDHVAFLS